MNVEVLPADHEPAATCPHRRGPYCGWLSSRLGSDVYVSGTRCQVHCKASGPYLGREAAAPETFLGIVGEQHTAVTLQLRLADLRPAELWGELHRRALAFRGDAAAEMNWLRGFRASLPCGDCTDHWDQMMSRSPPDFSSVAAFFAWTVDRHNEVNTRLDREPWSVAAAESRWGLALHARCHAADASSAGV